MEIINVSTAFQVSYKLRGRPPPPVSSSLSLFSHTHTGPIKKDQIPTYFSEDIEVLMKCGGHGEKGQGQDLSV